MTKHRFRNKLITFLGGHIDPDKDDELKWNNKEMEDNYKKILELLNAEDNDDRNRLIELIENFYKHHRSVYERYDHITGELKEKMHPKKEKDSSSSSSSDSESDGSLSKKGSKKGRLNAADVLKEQLQAANEHVEELTKKLTIATEECQTAMNKEQETQKMFEVLKLQVNNLHQENPIVLSEDKDNNLKFEKAKVLEAEYDHKLEELKAVILLLEEEKEGFRSELSRMKEKLDTTEEELTNICKKLEASEQERTSLSLKGSELSDEIKTNIEKIEELAAEWSLLKEQLTEKEKELLEHTEMHTSHKSETEIKIRGFEDNLESLISQKREVETQKEEEIKNLTEKVINLEKELESLDTKKSKLEEDLNEKQEEITSLHSQKHESESELEKGRQQISDHLNQIDFLKQELAGKMTDEQKLLEEKEVFVGQVKELEEEVKSLNRLKTELDSEVGQKSQEIADYVIQIENFKEEIAKMSQDNLQSQNQLMDKIQNLETLIVEKEDKVKEITEEIQKVTESKEQIVEQLEEAIEDLKGDIEIKGEDVTTLTETVRNLEVKIRLTNQKLRVTEQTLSEKETEYAGKEEKLHQENKSLIEKISTLSETITGYKESEESVKKTITQKVNAISTGMDSLNVKLEEDHGHISTQIYEIMNEIQVTKISMKKMSCEKDDLKEKVVKMMVQLKEVESERDTLKKSVDDLEQKSGLKDEKMKELEKQLHVKDEGLVDLGEEKREAIRQLCMLVDYQRDRYDHLQQLVSKRQTASNTERSSDHHHENVGPVTEAVKKRKWAILDDESDNWSNNVVEFYQNGDSTYCYSAVFFKNEKLDKQFWGTLLGYGCNGNLSSNKDNSRLLNYSDPAKKFRMRGSRNHLQLLEPALDNICVTLQSVQFKKMYQADCKTRISWKNVEIVKKFIGRTQERIDIWNDQCFAPWLNVKNTQPDGQLIHAMLLHQLPMNFDPEFDGIVYSVGGPDKEVLRFGPREFCIITGFKFGDNGRKSKGGDSFFNRVLDENISVPITVDKLKTFLVDDENNFNDDDIVRLCLLLILYSFFMGVETDKHIENDHLLLIWIYESFPYMKTICKYNEAIPRAIGWEKPQKTRWPTVELIFQRSAEVMFTPHNMYPIPTESKVHALSFDYVNRENVDNFISASESFLQRTDLRLSV
ncbi:hypothetical protein E3N88_15963 [Mikania micrantha]|uniref:NAB domain-containing protein n=1 Tax=Mikania micrantha TaxID=192012 RepID=A0A5N6NZ62_9ASTR|nr:hypothetical protein E3N88_15963 [Mikania micrantha]